jgi:hypothetical protein
MFFSPKDKNTQMQELWLLKNEPNESDLKNSILIVTIRKMNYTDRDLRSADGGIRHCKN